MSALEGVSRDEISVALTPRWTHSMMVKGGWAYLENPVTAECVFGPCILPLPLPVFLLSPS